MGTMIPVSSATRRKSPGITNPRTGWSQRSSASTATRSTGGEVELGLEEHAQFVAVERAAQRPLSEEP